MAVRPCKDAGGNHTIPTGIGVRSEPKNGITNKEFARYSDSFKRHCRVANVAPTARQASKFRSKWGKAYSAAVKQGVPCPSADAEAKLLLRDPPASGPVVKFGPH